jgi:putative peptide maturation system protein
MLDILPATLHESLEYLIQLWREHVSPEEARAQFQRLQARHRDLEMDLLWTHETYTGIVHYDVLLRRPGQGTVSLSFCPDCGVPWLLRQAHDAREGDLVRVNTKILTVEEAMACLDFIWNEARLITSLVHVCLIQEAVERRGIVLTDEDLQQTMDAFRTQHGLYTAEETYRWLEQHGMTHERLECHIAAQALRAKLRDQVTEGAVETYFERHASDFDMAYIARVKVAEAQAAQRLCEQLRNGVADFFETAQHQFLTDREMPRGQLFALVRRSQLSPPQAAAIFSAAPGTVVGPLRSGEGYDIVRVLDIERARLDPPMREAVKERLFEEWLAARRQEATIEWFWGNAEGSNRT